MKLTVRDIGGGPSLFLLHGLFGSGDNWVFVARRLEDRFRCILPDLRNHGGSGWSGPFGYRDMAADILDTADGLGLDRFHVLGHSLGAKTAMALALMAPGRVERMGAADMAPRHYDGSELLRLAGLMMSLDLSRLRSRREADAALAPEVPDPAIRGFLLKNLREEGEGFSWKLNLQALRDSFPGMAAWEESGTFTGPVLFLRGEKSRYIRDEDLPEARRFFPRAEMVTVPGAGHWVHADNPQFVIHAVARFFG